MYSIWRACERQHIKPPKVKESWEENSVEGQAELLAYNEIREHEELEEEKIRLKALGCKII